MIRFKRLAPALLVALLLVACIYRKEITFVQSDVFRDPMFFSKIEEIAKEKGYLRDTAKQAGEILFYRVTFVERQVENGNIVDYTNVSTDSLAVPYGMDTGTYQELYLANLPMNNFQDNLYVYYSLNYNADKKVIGFGPAYLGQLVPCPGDTTINQIEFFASLESRRKAPFVLQSNNEQTDMKFVLENFTPNSSIVVNKIIQAAPNKIGGSRPLVFNIDSTLGRGALNFKIVKK